MLQRSIFTVFLALTGALVACGSSSTDQPKGSTQSKLSADDDDDDNGSAGTGDDDDNQGGDDDDNAQSDNSAAPSGLFSNWCRAEVDIDDQTGNASCSISVWCGGWSTKSVVVSGPDGDPPCQCECQ
jgi:hypothetical protein